MGLIKKVTSKEEERGVHFIFKYNFVLISIVMAIISIFIFLDSSPYKIKVDFLGMKEGISFWIIASCICILVGVASLLYAVYVPKEMEKEDSDKKEIIPEEIFLKRKIRKAANWIIVVFMIIFGLFTILFVLYNSPPVSSINLMISLWFTLYIIFYILVLNKDMRSSSFFKFFYDFTSPFLDYLNIVFWIVLFIFIFPLVLINILLPLVNYLGAGASKVDVVSIIFGSWLAIISTFVGVRVFIEIKHKPIHDFKEFSLSVLHFLENISPHDEVNIIMPTLYLGRFSDNEEIHRLSKNIELSLGSIIENKSVKLGIALIEFDIDKLTVFSTVPLEADDISVRKRMDAYEELRNACPLSKFHTLYNMWEGGISDVSSHKVKIFQEYTKFMVDLHQKSSKESKLNNTLNSLKDYFTEEYNTGRFFLFSNITEGEHYLGIINEIEGQERINFTPSYITNKKLPKTFQRLFKSYLEEKSSLK